ncbi:hypothetical protein [Frondihabitans australicus]|uniref:hypothetical protein n=1 Tax=Frondihabitans australicus TaxID=386892 RepID=UPI0011C36F05|nr:hypothetical protein [Frondihabitans australicus]
MSESSSSDKPTCVRSEVHFGHETSQRRERYETEYSTQEPIRGSSHTPKNRFASHGPRSVDRENEIGDAGPLESMSKLAGIDEHHLTARGC